MEKKSSFLLIAGSLGLIIIAIILSVIIDTVKSKNNKTDIRAKAATGNLVFRGTISSYDTSSNIVVIDKLMFNDTPDKSLGTWTVTYPTKFNPTQFPAGTQVKITASPAVFQITTKTLMATDITK
jgi:hypothetical protein